MLKRTVLRVCVLLAGSAALALGEDGNSGQFKADLAGLNEVPSVITTGSGQLTVAVSEDQKSLDVTLTFTDLVGIAQSAGLYLALPGNIGGSFAVICGAPKPGCPGTADGSVTVTLTSADVIAIPTQGLKAGDLASVLQAMGDGAVYVNIITTPTFSGGEIRGQLRRGEGNGDGNGNGNGNDNGNGNGNGNGHGHDNGG